MSSETAPAPRTLLVGTLLGTLAFALTASGEPALRYISRLGFTDPRHTRADGYQSSVIVDAGPNAAIAGESERFVGVPDPTYGALPDRSAWMNVFEGTMPIGLYDAVHTSATGYHTTRVLKINRGATAVGHSIRYEGRPYARGQSAWIANWWGGVYRVGLFYDDPVPPLADGTVFNQVTDLVGDNCIGYAKTERGQAAWAADTSGVTTRLGYYDTAHTTPGRDPDNTAVAVSFDGTVVGYTDFNGSRIAWRHAREAGVMGPTPARIGVYDDAYRAGDGTAMNTPVAVNYSGFAIGTVRRRVPDAQGLYAGNPWVARPTGTTELIDMTERHAVPLFITDSNLVGGEFRESSDAGTVAWVYSVGARRKWRVGLGYSATAGARNTLLALTENGVALGATHTEAGVRAWAADPQGTTRQIGLRGPEYVSGGSSRSEIVGYNSEGVVIGVSAHATPDAVHAWIANPLTGATYRIGLYDAVHAGPAGPMGPRYNSCPALITDSRFVAGVSLRYHGGTIAHGQTAWIYNSPKAALAKIELSVRTSDGYAWSVVEGMMEEGIAYGRYRKFAEDGTDLGYRGFIWVTGQGARDAGESLTVEPSAVGWDHFTSASVGGWNIIAGYGTPIGTQSQAIYKTRIYAPPVMY